MISRRGLLSSFGGGLVIGAGSVEILSGKPNTGVPESKSGFGFNRKVRGDNIILEYVFPPSFDQKIMRPKIEIPKEKYIEETKTEKIYHNQIKDAINDEFVSNNISNEFVPDYESQNIRKIMNFVQNIQYSLDKNSTDSKNYSRHPVETLVDEVGDCKDKTILLYSILKNQGYNVGYVIYPQHIAPIVSRDEVEVGLSENIESVVENDKYEYIVMESTNVEYIGKTEYNSDQIIYSYTEHNGFKIQNEGAITEQARKMIDM